MKYKDFGLKYPTTKLQNDDLELKRKLNLSKCVKNISENEIFFKLKGTGLKWTRQARWGMRIFDFWNHEKGIAVEVDGDSHIKRKNYDKVCDLAQYKVSGIIVFRVLVSNLGMINEIIKKINHECSWKERRFKLKIL